MSDFPTEGSPPFINRRLSTQEWRQYVANYNFGRIAPTRLVLHHTYRPTEAQWAGLTTMRGIQRFYAGKGWRSGPHIFVGPDGIWLATPMSQVGIHAGTGNGSVAQGWYSIGLEMVGYFDTVRPAGRVWEFSLAVMGELSRRLSIAPDKLISFHRDYTNEKSCPGWAVTKDWVWSSVNAYVGNSAPPPPTPVPQPDPGVIQPADELLLEHLREASFRQRSGGQGYNPAWAFHQYAVQENLGVPLAPSRTVTDGGKQYDFQPFARETLYCEVPNWGDVRTLTKLLAGSIPPSGLGRRLLDETYKLGGSTFRPDWAFHQFALLNRLGPPIGNSANLTVDGRQYAYQVFATDTLYNLVPNWSDVRRLSQLSTASAANDVRLREALLAATYRASGQTYRPDWAFHQRARTLNIGAPLGASYQIAVGGARYALQVYALDTLYNLVPNWSDVRRMSDLVKPQATRTAAGVVLGSARRADESASSPSPAPFSQQLIIVRPNPPAMAHTSRNGRAIEQVILHAVPGNSELTLHQMSSVGSRFTTHYLVGLDGTIYQLVDEARAAWHAGMASADGLWFNLNLTSIGIALERPSTWPEASAGDTSQQLDALSQLLRELATRYPLTSASLMLWSSLAGSDSDAADGLPLEVLRAALKGA
ncbi:peptidoglycan recognition protein family protein [Candidatus Viridilinea mediisalina]|uniref:N-acetylmuramoyl-L-alanine amidase n=1 Tax=Candidatus Viridilinea mediisalina TaxID=2024553 RepID=A0A2A6RDV7_9CHLR|nr:peptidoglycan recognition family protein [Candidatus Viridilinea mediisalina]PDW00130.1 N-acetylmuramoyl-L-alanine amidase [Candidatus Viridilinea mediisalina]